MKLSSHTTSAKLYVNLVSDSYSYVMAD